MCARMSNRAEEKASRVVASRDGVRVVLVHDEEPLLGHDWTVETNRALVLEIRCGEDAMGVARWMTPNTEAQRQAALTSLVRMVYDLKAEGR